MKLLLFVLSCVLLFGFSSAYIVEVGPKAQECFSEHLNRGDKMSANYAVTRGGLLDINLKVIGPDSKSLLDLERETDGSFQLFALKEGTYQICFSNFMSTVYSKSVSFNIYTGAALQRAQTAQKNHVEPLDKSISSLADGVRRLSDTTRYIRGRSINCMFTSIRTSEKAAYFGWINCFVVIIAFALKVYLIRRPFEKAGVGAGAGSVAGSSSSAPLFNTAGYAAMLGLGSKKKASTATSYVAGAGFGGGEFPSELDEANAGSSNNDRNNSMNGMAGMAGMGMGGMGMGMNRPSPSANGNHTSNNAGFGSDFDQFSKPPTASMPNQFPGMAGMSNTMPNTGSNQPTTTGMSGLAQLSGMSSMPSMQSSPAPTPGLSMPSFPSSASGLPNLKQPMFNNSFGNSPTPQQFTNQQQNRPQQTQPQAGVGAMPSLNASPFGAPTFGTVPNPGTTSGNGLNNLAGFGGNSGFNNYQ